MLIVLNESVTTDQINHIVNFLGNFNLEFQFLKNDKSNSILIPNSTTDIDDTQLKSFAGVNEVRRISTPYKLASREVHPQDTVVDIGGIKIGGNNFTLIAGPCSVENEKQIFEIATFLVENGIKLMRGGAFKPRTSPYSFQGLGREGLKLLGKVRAETGLKIVSEAMDIVTIEEVSEHVDMIQIGSRSMQNFPLLKKAGQLNKPVLLKRGFSATIEELLLSSEYILNEGNSQIVLCERGIRTFNDHSRNMLDLAAIPIIKDLTHLPIIVDPSHASGDCNKIVPLSKAALAIGSDGLLIEIHPNPENALSDGNQSLSFGKFSELLSELHHLGQATDKNIGY